MEIGLKLGYAAKYIKHSSKGEKRIIENREINQNYDAWHVCLSNKILTPRPHKETRLEEWIPSEDGRIYCAVVKNHIMIVRRNGKAFFSGNTGYGVGSAGVVYPLNQYYDVRCLGYWGAEGVALGYNGLIVYPKLFGLFGEDAAELIIKNWRPDVLVTLFDVWINESEGLMGGRGWLGKMHPRWIPIVPVDHDPIPYPIAESVSSAYRVVAMSQFGHQQFSRAGIDSIYIPHGVDTNVFKPTQDKSADRKHMVNLSTPFLDEGAAPWDDDCFVLMMNAANKDPRRKGFDRMFTAAQIFLEQNPDAKKDFRIYLHTWARFPGGLNLDHLANIMHVAEYVRCTHRYHMYCGLTPETLARLYMGSDVFYNASMAEGFGIPIIEASACGIPTIATRFTSMTELTEGHGWLVDPLTKEWTMLLSLWSVPNEYQAADMIADAYNHPDKVRSLGAKAREFSLNYDWKNVVVPLWTKLMEEVREEIRPKSLAERRLI